MCFFVFSRAQTYSKNCRFKATLPHIREAPIRQRFSTTPVTMALPPKFKGHRLAFHHAGSDSLGQDEPPHTVEMYLDYVCPFSAKMFNTVFTAVAPAVRADAKLASRVQFVFRQQVQPWHPSSTLVHEAAAAVLRLAPSRFWDFSAALFAAQNDYFDVSVVKESRNDTYKRLARLSAAAAGLDEKDVYALLVVSEAPPADGSLNVGNGVTADLKVMIKMARLVGVHVSPTVIFDGVVANDISSSWTKEQWLEWLEKNVA